MSAPFLTAEWRKLIILNYAIDPEILKPYLPNKTELELWNGTCYISLVGFRFLNTKLKGISIPFHRNFEEVNLRFYVKRTEKNGEQRRGVVFIKEIAPKRMLAFVANMIYKENYVTMPMKHSCIETGNSFNIKYSWKNGHWNSISVISEKDALEMLPSSEEEFITEHYWGYTKVSRERTAQYFVEHPRWKVYKVKLRECEVDFGSLYGNNFSCLTNESLKSVMLAEGSGITVHSGTYL
jgi:uncharacterized protein